MSSRIEQVIDEIELFISECKYQTFSTTNIIVDKDRMDELLRDLRLRTPEEIKKYQKIISNKERILQDARDKADAMLNMAQAETVRMVDENEIMQQAYAQAGEVVKQATEQAQQIVDMATLEEIVRTNEKQRFSFNEDKTKIRANQGHTIPVDVELEEKAPPAVLYHGTGDKYVESIDQTGLEPRQRLYVHLSTDKDMAAKVGQRHGEPVVYRVDSGQMARDGYTFYLSVNGVWLTKAVPVKYLEKL